MTFPATALRRLKMSMSMDRLVRRMRLNACFLFFTASAHSLFHQGTLILWEFLDCGIDASCMETANVVQISLIVRPVNLPEDAQRTNNILKPLFVSCFWL